IPVAMYFKVAPKGWSDSAVFVDLPWMHQMGLTFLITIAIIAVISIITGHNKDDAKGIKITKKTFYTDPLFNILSFSIMLILVMLYAMFW
ncbi:MAG: hypothetical protein KAH25_01615, partial [Bacteroidales bacterium]|nr:hypothetical protein [Bacteroidales bacterium]